ncbi:cell division protein SepF [Actinopolymorpha pittospori]|uniref:Cell division protein SepF n=1 Tax=Actinopolymorpha pittospori TaxID=648752 RepID=A0A927RH95_9ACTN|nr:FtsZ-interacting cell division protein YlmF [Actinopolymorpha pittospori]
MEEFVSALAAAFEVALDLESSAPVVAVLDQWKDAAAAHADPEIATQLLTQRTGDVGAAAPMPRVVTMRLRTYKDTTQMARHLRSRAAVIMDVSGMDGAEATRALNFASGMVFGLRGRIEQVTDTVFLLTPEGTTVEGALSDPAATGGGRDSARR